jgi:hypothetical protein
MGVNVIEATIALPPPSINCPLELTDTIADWLADAAAPKSSATDRVVCTPFARAPVVFMLVVHGLTVTVWPLDKGRPAGNEELEILKIQEPKVVVPVAVLPPEVILNAGVSPPLVNVRVVAAVVPNSGTPEGKPNVVPANAPAIVPLTFSVVSPAATKARPALLPSPQADSIVTTAATDAINFKRIFFIFNLF